MFNQFDPFRYLYLTIRLKKYVLTTFVVVLIIGLLEALIFSPQDYLQSDSVRIMYVHVPSAWISIGTVSYTHLTLPTICSV